MKDNHTIAVVIPCFKVAEHIEMVIKSIPDWVDHIIVVDDACPNQTAELIKSQLFPRLTVLSHSVNKGVGAAMITGYHEALRLKCDIIIKMDGDGQMSGTYLHSLIEPLIHNKADYTKGNRFHDFSKLRKMPKIRLFGNSILSFISKFTSGYWHLMDSTNGFTAINKRALQTLNFKKISSRYFFEIDMLVNLYINGFIVQDIPIPAIYNDETSNLNILKILFDFPPKIVNRFFRRIFYRYYIYDFNMASIYFALSIPMITFGTLFGSYHWIMGAFENIENTAGTVMLAAMPFILGVQFLLQAIQIDINHIPRKT